MKNKILVLLFLGIVAFQCKNESLDTEIIINENNNDNFKYSQLFESAKLVKLDTNDDCLIIGVTKLDVDDDRIIIQDSYSNMIFVFSLEGKFLAKIGVKGRGPGEFIAARAYSLDREKNRIHVVDTGSREILVFDYDGNYLSQRDGMWATGYEYLNDNSDLFYHYNTKFVDGKGKVINGDIAIVDEKGSVSKTFDVRTVNRDLNLNTFTNLYKTEGNDVYIIPIFDYSLFKISPDLSIIKVADFRFNNQPPPEIFQSNTNIQSLLTELNDKNYPNRLQRLIVSNKYLYATYILNNRSNQIFIDRKNNKTFVITRNNWVNDIAICSYHFFHGSYRQGMVQSINADSFLESYVDYLNDPHHESLDDITLSEIERIVKSSHKDDNPILFFYKFK